MAKRLSKKKVKQIAEIWAAGLLLQAGIDSFSQDWGVSNEHQDRVLREVDIIATRLLKGRKQQFTLNEVIKNTINK